LISFCLLAFASSASAQDPASGRDAEARALYEAGVIAYDGGHFDEALEHFQRSYELSGRTALLYNIGTAAERTRDDALAIQSYEAFLAMEPESPLRARVETRLAELRERQAEAEARAQAEREEEARRAEARAQADAAAQEAVQAEPAPSEARRGPGPAIVIGAGAAVAVAGAVMLGIGLADRAAVESPSAGSSWREDVEPHYARGEALLSAGLVALPVGALAAVAGTIWQVKRGSRGDDDGGVALDVGLGRVTLRGRF
jgi:tetratricopeptide (TPR) repeat protein